MIRGRVWADRAHRVTVLSLVGFSSSFYTPLLSASRSSSCFFLSAFALPTPSACFAYQQCPTVVVVAVAGLSLTDMILHNRRKRTAFYNEQHAIYARRLIEAIETEKSGLPLDEDQTVVLNRERARVQAEEAAKERTWAKRIKGVFIGDLKRDTEEGEEGGEEALVVPSEGEILQKLGVHQMEILERATARADKDSGFKTTDPGDGRDEGKRDGSGILQAVA